LPRLAALDEAALFVDAGHGDIATLTKGAPRLAGTAARLREAARGNLPCGAKW